jgi:hypothetical protein
MPTLLALGEESIEVVAANRGEEDYNEAISHHRHEKPC